MDGHLSDILRLLKNGQKSDSFSDHFEQYFNFTKYPTYLYKYMKVKNLSQIIQWTLNITAVNDGNNSKYIEMISINGMFT